MKNFVLIAAMMFLLSLSVLGQKDDTAATAAPAQAAPAAVPFVREKFDPTRDPKLDLEKAIAQTSKNGKHIILDIGGEWCGWCVFMDKFLVQNTELAKLKADNFVWVKVNFSEENENAAFLSAYPKAAGYPHLYVLNKAGKLLHSEDTSLLEKGKGYDLEKFTAFLKAWSPKKG